MVLCGQGSGGTDQSSPTLRYYFQGSQHSAGIGANYSDALFSGFSARGTVSTSADSQIPPMSMFQQGFTPMTSSQRSFLQPSLLRDNSFDQSAWKDGSRTSVPWVKRLEPHSVMRARFQPRESVGNGESVTYFSKEQYRLTNSRCLTAIATTVRRHEASCFIIVS